MPLELLVPLIIVGLAAVFLSVHLTGGSAPGEPLDEAGIAARYLEDHPGDAVSEIHRDPTGSGPSWLRLESDPAVGFVRPFGRHHVTRRLDAATIRGYAMHGDTIRLRLRDTGQPALDVATDAADLLAVLDRVAGKTRSGPVEKG